MTILTRLAELKALAEKATAGRWVIDPDVDGSGIVPWTGAIGISPEGEEGRTHLLFTTRGGDEQANAALIVALVNALPAIIQECEAMGEREAEAVRQRDALLRELGRLPDPELTALAGKKVGLLDAITSPPREFDPTLSRKGDQ
jgi:hypothetical protein